MGEVVFLPLGLEDELVEQDLRFLNLEAKKSRPNTQPEVFLLQNQTAVASCTTDAFAVGNAFAVCFQVAPGSIAAATF